MSPCIWCVQAPSTQDMLPDFPIYLAPETCLEAICTVHLLAAHMSRSGNLANCTQYIQNALHDLQVATAHDPIQGEVAESGKSQTQPRIVISSATI